MLAKAPEPHSTPSVVYAIHEPAAIDHLRTNAAVVRGMVDRLVVAVTAQPNVAQAWRSLVAPSDVVGIKISAAGGELFATHRDVVSAIVEGLAAAGVARENVVVWDRNVDQLRRADYRRRNDGYQLLGIEPRDGYAPKPEITAPLLGKLVWGDLAYVPLFGVNPIAPDSLNNSNVSHFTKILTSRVTKVINVPVLSESETTGLAGCIYNMTLPNIDNWHRFVQYQSFGASSMAEIYSDPHIRGKVVLHLMDGLAALYAGGPAADPNFAVQYGTLLAAKDPVAIDTLALQRIEEWRANAHLPPVGTRAAHVQIAGQLGLGNADRSRIELKELRR